MNKRYYFAYGSNMNRKQMSKRCPAAEPLATARLENYKFLINQRGVASIQPKDNYSVYGVVWLITPECEAELDRREGVHMGIYQKEEVQLKCTSGLIVSCLVYIDKRYVYGKPRDEYMPLILEGAKLFDLPKEYIAGLEQW